MRVNAIFQKTQNFKNKTEYMWVSERCILSESKANYKIIVIK